MSLSAFFLESTSLSVRLPATRSPFSAAGEPVTCSVIVNFDLFFPLLLLSSPHLSLPLLTFFSTKDWLGPFAFFVNQASFPALPSPLSVSCLDKSCPLFPHKKIYIIGVANSLSAFYRPCSVSFFSTFKQISSSFFSALLDVNFFFSSCLRFRQVS